MIPHVPRGLPVHKSNGRTPKPREDRTLSHGVPAEPLLRVLPIKRWIPQDVHSVMDYAGGLSTAAGYFTAEADNDDVACIASIALGASVIGVSALTDYRLSAVKLIPIRAHETIDYAWGASAIALPFVLGYWKTSPRTALMHVIAGASTLLASLFTDYRSFKEQKRTTPAARTQADFETPVMPT